MLLLAAVAMLVPAIAATPKVAAAAVMGLSSLRFAVTGVAELSGDGPWTATAGVVGLVLAAVALYASFGFELEDARHRTVLPLLRRGPAHQASHGDVTAQLRNVAREAGVREQL